MRETRNAQVSIFEHYSAHEYGIRLWHQAPEAVWASALSYNLVRLARLAPN